MNRRQFLYFLASTVPIVACSERVAEPEKPVRFSSKKKTDPLLVKGDNYLRDLAKQVYPKIEQVRVPLDREVLYYDLGRWKSMRIKTSVLRPSVGEDGILTWASESL